MSIKRLLGLQFYNGDTAQWEEGVYKTDAAAVTTKNGNLQDELDAIPGSISASAEAVKEELKGSVPTNGDTLKKLYDSIETIKTLLNTDDLSLDTLQEVVDYIKANRDDLTLIGANKVSYSDIINSLDTVSTVENKVLDARQGKVLNDAINVVKSELEAVEVQCESFITKDEANDLTSSMLPVISETAPANPKDGQIWFRPAGTIS